MPLFIGANESYDTDAWEAYNFKKENAKLRDENKKLREFAKMMLLVCKNQGIVGGIFTYPDRNNNINEYVDFECRARELGVEVD